MTSTPRACSCTTSMQATAEKDIEQRTVRPRPEAPQSPTQEVA